MAYKILIVEDDIDLMELLKSKLSKNGYQVKATISCKEGLEIFYSFKPDLVLSDINVGHEGEDEIAGAIAMMKRFGIVNQTIRLQTDALKNYQ